MGTKIAKDRQLVKVLLLDNYDSFTHILLRTLSALDLLCITVKKNDEISLAEAQEFDAFVLSPGPGFPATSGICCELIRQYAASKPMLGICLGHQAIAEVFGAQLYNLPQVQHGRCTQLTQVIANPIFDGLTSPIKVGLYHSWAVAATPFPDCLEITSRSTEGTVMSIAHKEYPIIGLQFHPESIMTPQGPLMLKNWAESLKV